MRRIWTLTLFVVAVAAIVVIVDEVPVSVVIVADVEFK